MNVSNTIYKSKHRRHHHTGDGDRVLVFWKTPQKARKAILGALYNMGSRIISGVIAGVIMTQFINAPTQDRTNVPSTGAAIGGAVIN